MKENKKKRSWKRVVSILSGVVVFCTTYALILPAVTMSKETYCGMEAHVHTEACYRSQTPLCGEEEGEPNEGHVHDETCYEEVRNLICGLEESETHIHTDECYETTTTQTCGKEESEPSEGHTHSDECYKSEELQCGKEEHEHTRICESNKEDVEDPADWEKAYQDINDEEDAKTRILTVAKNELGTKENKNNFEIDEEGKEHYYTRYGHLYEDQYGDWNNYFTGYVLKYANIQMSYDKDASKWQNKTIHDQKEEGEEGNVVFFRNDKGELRTGIVTSIDDLKKEIRVIEGNVEGEVKEERVNKDKVIAYLNDQIEIMEEDTPLAGEELEKEEENKITQTAKDEAETVEVTATYMEEANIPEGAQLTVTKLEDAENGNPRFDIGFYVGQEEVEPNAEVEISIKYLDEKLDGSEIVDYIHYKKDGSTETISSDVKALEDGSVETTFKTDSFSVFEAEIIVGVKKVEIEGLDKEYEIGDEVTLKAVTKNIVNLDELSYQWQYNEYDPENEEYWFNFKGETNQEYNFKLSDENCDLYYRVILGTMEELKKNTHEKPNGFTYPPQAVKKLNLRNKATVKRSLIKGFFQNIEDETTEDSNEEDELIVSEYQSVDIRTVTANIADKEFTNNHDPNKVLHNKSIQYLGSGESVDNNKRDDYRISVSSGPIAGDSPVDILFIVDTSGSMNDESKMNNLKNNLDTIIPQFLNCNSRNRYSIIRFAGQQYGSDNYSSDTSVYRSWTREFTKRNQSGYNGTLTNLRANGGTNYTASLILAQSQLENLLKDTTRSDSKKIVVFLSDGAPTYATYIEKSSWGTISYKRYGTGSNLSTEGIEETNKRINTFRAFADENEIEVNTIFYGDGGENAKKYLKALASNDKCFYTTSETQALLNHFILISQGPTCTNGKMTDMLSEYVDFDTKNYDVVVKAYKGGKDQDPDGTVIFRSNNLIDGSFVNSITQDVNLNGIKGLISVNGEIKPQVKINEKTITLEFNSNWQMDASFLYELSFNVYANKTAYDTEGNEGYKDTGDDETGATSAGIKGLNSNTNGSFSFTYDNKNYDLEYKKPVIQIIRTDLTLTKIGNGKTPLSGAKFDLYKKDENGQPISGLAEVYNGNRINLDNNPITSDSNGKISLTDLSVGTYYLVEIVSPDGYTKAQKPWELVIEAKEDREGKVQLYYLLKDLNKTGNEVVEEGKLLDFTDKNKSGSISHDRWKYYNDGSVNIVNEPGQSLPNTGGAGTQLFTFSGGAIIAASSLMYGYKKRSKRNKTGKGGK